MIKPKHSFGKKEYSFTEEFVDRKEAKNLYRNKLNNNDKQYNVLSFYGLGGIGKTKLRKEICRIHQEENAEGIIFYLDLQQAEDRNLGEGILKLVDSCNVKIDFKCFELAYALYFRKKHPSVSYDRGKELLTQSTYIGIGLNIIGIFDNGLTSTTAEIIERTIRAIKNRSIDKSVQEELNNFDDYSIAEMEERLPMFFQYDLKSYISKHPESRVLMVFDAFEALNENILEQIHRNANERWVKEIIEYFDSEEFPKMITVIFGRDKIEWEDEWQELLDQYQLKEFTEDYSLEYLQRVGITEINIAKSIYKSSNGYPLMLYLSAETYMNLKNSGKEPSVKDFTGGYPEIISRFVYYLDKDTVEVLRLLSIPNYYDLNMFNRLIKEFNISFPLTEYEQFNKYSFVSFDEKDNEYYIHDLVRKGILDNTPDELIKTSHAFLLDYFTRKVSQNVLTKYVIEFFYHSRSCKTCEEFNKWLKTPFDLVDLSTPLSIMKVLQTRGEQIPLMQILNGIISKYGLENVLVDIVNIYIDIVHVGGDYLNAVEMCDSYLKQYSEIEIINDEQLLKMRIRKIHHSMFFVPVDKLIKEALNLIKRMDADKFHEEYNEVLFLLGGNLGVLSGRFDFASLWLEKSIAYAKKNKMDAFIHRTVRKKADIALFNDQIDKAIRLINTTVTVETSIESVDSRYKIYLVGALGECYRKSGKLDLAWHCYDIVDKKSTKNHLPGWQAHANLGKGMVMLYKREFAEADAYINKALKIYTSINQQWGIINAVEARLLLEKKKSGLVNEAELKKCRDRAELMNYTYNVKFIDSLVEEEPYLQLFFL